MNLKDIPSGEVVFIDANIPLYVALKDKDYGRSSKEFLSRVENREFRAFTSTLILDEILHKLMLSETMELHSLEKYGDAIVKLRRDPTIIAGIPTWWEFNK